MRLQLQHLAPYLPYELKAYQTIYTEVRGGRKDKITTEIRKVNSTSVYNFFQHSPQKENPEKYIKPILRPLSDLTKEIEVNGEKFVPINLLEIDSSTVDFNSANNQPIIKLVDCEFIYVIDVYNNITQKLLEWHFDVFGLIERGLAIDINTLEL